MRLGFIGLQAHGFALWMVLVLESEQPFRCAAFVHMHGAVLGIARPTEPYPLIPLRYVIGRVVSKWVVRSVGPRVCCIQQGIRLIRGMCGSPSEENSASDRQLRSVAKRDGRETVEFAMPQRQSAPFPLAATRARCSAQIERHLPSPRRSKR